AARAARRRHLDERGDVGEQRRPLGDRDQRRLAVDPDHYRDARHPCGDRRLVVGGTGDIPTGPCGPRARRQRRPPLARRREVRVSVASDSETHATVTVTDDGPGIPAEHHGDVFGRYWTT